MSILVHGVSHTFMMRTPISRMIPAGKCLVTGVIPILDWDNWDNHIKSWIVHVGGLPTRVMKHFGIFRMPSGKKAEFANLKMAIEIVDLPMKHGDCP